MKTVTAAILLAAIVLATCIAEARYGNQAREVIEYIDDRDNQDSSTVRVECHDGQIIDVKVKRAILKKEKLDKTIQRLDDACEKAV